MKHKHQGNVFTETELGRYYICDDCGQKFVSNKRKLANLWIAQRFFQGRGASYTGQLMGIYNTIQTGGILYLVLGGTTGNSLPILLLLGYWLSQTIFETYVGHKDWHKWRIAQNENVYGLQFRSVGRETLERLRNIERILCEGLKPKEIDKGAFMEKEPLPYEKSSLLDENK